MSKDRPRNTVASVRARLAGLARKQHEDFQLVLTRYAIERLLYRLTPAMIRDLGEPGPDLWTRYCRVLFGHTRRQLPAAVEVADGSFVAKVAAPVLARWYADPDHVG